MEFEYQELAPSRRRAACNLKAEDQTRAGYSDIMMNRGRLRRARVVESRVLVLVQCSSESIQAD